MSEASASPRPGGLQMAGGAAIGVAGRVLTALIGHVNLIFAARLLSPDQFGLFMLAVTTVTTLTVLGAFGADHSILATVAKALPADVPGARDALRAITQLVLVASGVLTVALIAGAAPLAGLLGEPAAAGLLAIVAVALPFGALMHVTRSAAQSSFAFVNAVFAGGLLQVSLLLAAYMVALAIGGFTATLVAWAYAASFVVAAVASVVALGRRTPLGWAWLRPARAWSVSQLGLSSRFLVIQFFVNMRGSVVVYVLASALAATEVGLYAAASRTAGLVAFVLVGINLVFSPMIASLWGMGEVAGLGRVYRRSTKWSLAVALPVCIVLIAAAPGVLEMFGPGFIAATPALIWLAVGQLVNAATGSVGYLLMLTGRERTMMWNTVGVTLVSAAAAAWVAPRFGVTGAAAVGGLVLMLFNVIMLAQVGRSLKLQPYDGETIRVLAAGALALGAGLLVRGWAWTPGRPWVLGMMVTVGAVLTVYSAAFLALALSPDDRALLATARSRLARRSRRAGAGV